MAKRPMNKRLSIRFLLALALLTLLGSWGLVQAAPVAAGILSLIHI